MKKLVLLSVLLLSLAGSSPVVGQYTGSNDHMFPPADAAKPFINFDARGFLINGKRTFLASACMDYSRVPHELWADRLMRLKMAGYNTIEFYCFWNFHEPVEGQFNFSGDHDLDAFLKLVKQMGLYAIARLGPYSCAEWNFGGYPIWLSFKPGVMVREPNIPFQNYYNKYFDKLIPIVANNQINKGGCVILAQMENENPIGWGTDVPNSYYANMQSKALSLGLQVPYFFSGLHHGFDPGEMPNLDDSTRPSPWFTTEVYSGWFIKYGASVSDATSYGRLGWNIIAHGGNGYAHYMGNGGSNFEYNNSDADAASYDYGSPVGETGDLRPTYYSFKRSALFARSFADITENSIDATPAVQGMLTNTLLKATARQGPAGSILFIDNPKSTVQQTQIVFNGKTIPSNGTLTLQSKDIVPIVYNYQLTPGVKIDFSAGKILGISKQGNTTTLVTYGEPNDAGQFQFSSPNPFQLIEGNEAFSVNAKKALLSIIYPVSEPATYAFKSGTKTIRIVALNSKLADRTWFTDVQGTEIVITGPEYVAGVTISNNTVQLKTEHAWNQAVQYPTWVYGDNLKLSLPLISAQGNHNSNFPLNGAWQVKNASMPAGVNFDDSQWLKSDSAQFMGADNNLSNAAWYRTTLNITKAGIYKFDVHGGGTAGLGRAIVFIDSVRVASGKLAKDALQFSLTAGKHSLAVFTAHDGRNHLPLYIGDLSAADPKGLGGYIDLADISSTAPKTITDWTIIKVSQQSDINNMPSPAEFAAAPSYTVGSNPFNLFSTSYAWFGAIIPVSATNVPRTLVFESLDDIGTVFINGINVGSSKSYQAPFTVQLEGLIDPAKTNYVTIFLKNASGPGGIAKPVDILYNTIKGWSMQGGPGNFVSTTGYSTLTATTGFGRPTFYRNTFALDLSDTVSYPVYRVVNTGLGHGSIWVNGHNLGRYPAIIAINGLYIPECWLVNGQNTVVIYDEDGNLPTKVSIQAEVAASRDVTTITHKLPNKKTVSSNLSTNTKTKLSATLSPNPAKESVKVIFQNIDGGVYVQLFNMNGNKLWQSQKGNFSSLQVPMSKLTTGEYLIVVKDNSETQTLKLSKAE